MESITLLYEIRLVALVVLLMLTFYGYGQFVGRHVPQLSGFLGGFIAFLALNELLALPFMLLHWGFGVFWPIFVVINGLFLVSGATYLFRKKTEGAPLIRYIRSRPLLIAVIAVVVLCAGSTQIWARYDADDAYYVSLVQQSMNSTRLYTGDPPTGNPDAHMDAQYRFEGWELIQASLAKSFALMPLELTHGLIPIVMVVLAFLAHWRIFRLIFGKDNTYVEVSMILAGVVLLFGGYSLYSQGLFLLTRSWQGKAALATIIIPVAFYLGLRLFEKVDPRKSLYLALGITSIAGLALNSTAIFTLGSMFAVFTLMLMLKGRRRQAIAVVLTASPLVLISLGILLYRSLDSYAISNEAQDGFTVWIKIVQAFVGESAYFYVGTLGLALLLLTNIAASTRHYIKLILIFVGLYVLLIINPLFYPLLSDITASTYWRFLWVIPITIIAPVAGALIIKLLAKKDVLYNRTILAAVILLFVASGSWVHSLGVIDLSRQKLPAAVYGTLAYMQDRPEGYVVAASDVAAYYHTVDTKQELYISRLMYFVNRCGDTLVSNQCKGQFKLFNIANGTGEYSPDDLKLLDVHKVRYFIVNRGGYQGTVPVQFRVGYTNDQYVVYERANTL